VVVGRLSGVDVCNANANANAEKREEEGRGIGGRLSTAQNLSCLKTSNKKSTIYFNKSKLS
jgi:hypothetical protein